MATLIVQERLDKKANQFYNIGTPRIDLDQIVTEADLVKFVKNKFGSGRYNLMIAKDGQKGFRQVWYGTITEDSYKREKGKLVQYMDNISKSVKAPRDQWIEI